MHGKGVLVPVKLLAWPGFIRSSEVFLQEFGVLGLVKLLAWTLFISYSDVVCTDNVY